MKEEKFQLMSNIHIRAEYLPNFITPKANSPTPSVLIYYHTQQNKLSVSTTKSLADTGDKITLKKFYTLLFFI